jgi:hypothetical protein
MSSMQIEDERSKMNKRIRRHPLVAVVIVMLLLAVAGVSVYAIDTAGSMNALPWQTVPTPYSGGAFEGIPGFDGAVIEATPAPVATP